MQAEKTDAPTRGERGPVYTEQGQTQVVFFCIYPV